jgi:DNA mismatch repair protein MutS2
MDAKTLQVLEYPKVLERLAAYSAFSASAELARALKPSTRAEMVLERQRVTSEARLLLSVNTDISVGGTSDIRPLADLAARGGVLNPSELMQVKTTLEASRDLHRYFDKSQAKFPLLFGITSPLAPPPGIIEAISRCISEHAEIRDTASPKLASIRRELKIAYDRLMSKLERMITDPRITPILQEAIITQRGGRYVIPLRADFKGRIRAIVHDQSSSGATLFIEPLATVDLNNEWQEKQLAERDEERRILAELSAVVGEHAEALTALLNALAELDLALACAKYAEDLHASEPLIPELVRWKGEKHPGSTIRLYHARHPLLDPEKVVPIDFDLNEGTFAVVITGPNTGGKTVSLKTVGLLALMAQSGLHIPAGSGSVISCFHQVYADIGDEQSIEQSLSTFSGHITNIVRILRMADRGTLVILDELGAGTDPQEGAALARSLLNHLLSQSVTTLVTTHHPELKAYAHATPGVVNASVEFDLETLRPSYHLTIGLPGRSNALAIAQRLGMPEAIVSAARAELDPADLRAEDLLDEIHRQRDLARQARASTEQARREAESMRNELAERLEQIEDERRELLEKARQQAEQEVREVQDELREVRRSLARARQPVESLQSVEEQVQALEETVEEPVQRRVPKLGEKPLRRAVRLGDKVRLRSLNMQGVLTSLSEDEAEVQVGVLRVRARRSDLILAGEADTATAPAPVGESRPATPANFPASPGLELDLRGQRADEAQDALERYLDSAYLAGLPWVRIIHGRGTGKLRDMVRQALQGHPQVRSFESGGDKEGGEGVTVVKLRNS